MGIAFLGIAMTLVQAFDGVIGALAHDPAKTYGPFAFAILNGLAVGWLLRGKVDDLYRLRQVILIATPNLGSTPRRFSTATPITRPSCWLS